MAWRNIATRAEPIAAHAEEVRQLGMAYGLDHLDRDQLVELAAQLAVVLEAQLHPFREACGRDALPGQRVLLA
jgi:hypothetical protein